MNDPLSSLVRIQNLLLEAANLSLGWYNRRDFDVTTKTDNSPVTQADLEVHQVLHKGLLELYPNIPFLSEEAEIPPHNERQTWQAFWLCDPIDGTKEFVSHTDEWTINLALILRDASGIFQVQAGWVLAPALGLFFQGMCPPAHVVLGLPGSALGNKPSAWRAQIDADDSERTSQSRNSELSHWEPLVVNPEKRMMLAHRLSAAHPDHENGANLANLSDSVRGDSSPNAGSSKSGPNFAPPAPETNHSAPQSGPNFAPPILSNRASPTPNSATPNFGKSNHFNPNTPNLNTDRPTLKIPASRNHRQPELESLLESVAPFETITVGSSLKFCRVAEGLADYYPRPIQLNEWDIAAAHGVLKAAGGNVYVIERSEGQIKRFEPPREACYNSADVRAPMFEAY